MSTNVRSSMQELKVQSEAKQLICEVGLYRIKHELEAMRNLKKNKYQMEN